MDYLYYLFCCFVWNLSIIFKYIKLFMLFFIVLMLHKPAVFAIVIIFALVCHWAKEKIFGVSTNVSVEDSEINLRQRPISPNMAFLCAKLSFFINLKKKFFSVPYFYRCINVSLVTYIIVYCWYFFF